MKKLAYTLFILAALYGAYLAADTLVPGETGSRKAQRVEFDDVDNCRQLGGYTNRQGRTVRSGALIRSGKLCKLTEEGMEQLRAANVRTVIDLRVPEEIAWKPDPRLPHVKHLDINLAAPGSVFYKMSVWGVGVSHENYDSVVTAIAKEKMNLGEMYIEGIVESDYARQALRQIFSEFAAHKDGAILWHCSGGKDRTGMVAALLLELLDVDRETVLDDYELTNEFVPGERLVMSIASHFFGDTEDEKLHVATIAGVRREFMKEALSYIDSHYGSPAQFLHNQCGVSDADFQKIRDNFLED